MRGNLRHPVPSLLVLSVLVFAWSPGEACDPKMPPEMAAETGALVHGEAPAGRTGRGKSADLPADIATWSFPMSVASICRYQSECQPSLTSVTDPGVTPYIYFVAGDQVGPVYDPDDVWSGFSIYEARWDGAQWTDMRVLPSPVNPGAHPSVTASGDTLYLVQAGRIKLAYKSAGDWDTVVPLPAPFNATGVQYEAPEICRDGTHLYFVMNGWVDGTGTVRAPDGTHPANNDIWVAHWNGSSWDSLANLGAGVNTTGVETRPTISPDETRLVFSDFGRDRPGEDDFGGVDLFVSVLEGGVWQPAVPLPAPVNTDHPACSGHWADDGTVYVASGVSEGGFGEEDLWHTEPDGATPAIVDHHPLPVHDGPATPWSLLVAFPGEVIVHDLLAIGADTILAATAPGGLVYRATDGGASWSAVTLDSSVIRVYDLERAPDGTIYASTYPNGAVFRSVDAGASWSACGAIPNAPTAVRALLLLSNGDLLAGVSPAYEVTPGGPTVGRVYRSANGGATWTASGTLPQVEGGVFDLAEPAPGIVLAGALVYGARIHRSTNYGVSWSVVTLFTADGTPGVTETIFSRADTVYAVGWKHGLGGVLSYSTNDGASWTRVTLPTQEGGIWIGRVFDIEYTDAFGWLLGIHPGPGTIAWRSGSPLSGWEPLGHLEDARELLRVEPLPDGRVLAATSGFGEIWVIEGGTEVAGPPEPPAGPGSPRFDLVLRNPAAARLEGRLVLPESGRVRVEIFDVRGARLGTLWDGVLDAGERDVSWEVGRPGGRRLSRGVYLVRVSQGSRFVARKVVLGLAG